MRVLVLGFIGFICALILTGLDVLIRGLRMSDDSFLIQLLRFGRAPGDPGRDLVKKGPVVWAFPKDSDDRPAHYEAFLPHDTTP